MTKQLSSSACSNDQPSIEIAHSWLREGRSFTGMITWPQVHYERMTDGDILEKFDALAEQDDPFNPDYPIVHLRIRCERLGKPIFPVSVLRSLSQKTPVSDYPVIRQCELHSRAHSITAVYTEVAIGDLRKVLQKSHRRERR